jgi:ABC-type transport system involved in multi-copper enzyme maturation permease subunit
VYITALLGLISTAWLIVFGSQPVRTLGDLSRFGAAVFSLIAPVQLAIAMGFSALLTAAAVAQEKDRRTLDLLLMTRMTNSELVIGRLFASMLTVLVMVLASVPLLMLITLLGGVSHEQVGRVVGVTAIAAIAAGSLGSMLALWREKTFQTLAITALALMLWLLVGEAIAAGVFGTSWSGASAGEWAEAISPVRAILAAARPRVGVEPMLREIPILGSSTRVFLMLAAGLAVLLNAIAIARVRVWNPTREARPQTQEQSEEAAIADATEDANTRRSVHAAPGRTRQVWDNPILWREICTWAYGKKVIAVRVAYIAVFTACAWAAAQAMQNEGPIYGASLPRGAQALVPLLVLGLVLVNALAVTSITNERDSKALDLLLVTDLTPKEIIFGKLGGILFNAKEMILLPIVLCLAMWGVGWISAENLVFSLFSFSVLNAFVAVLGLHAGMSYENSRSAVAVSLGTLLFLLLGVAVCMRMMVAFQSSFSNQFQAFLAFMLGGGIGLVAAVGRRNASQAIWWAFGFAPLVTFFAIVNFLDTSYGAAAIVTILTYGFATAAMLIPAVYEFDVATGRTTAKDI